jgi:glycosyltransferase involved in cell wall biosynthesis
VDSEDLKRAVMAFGVLEDRIAVIQWGVDVGRIRSFKGCGRLRQLANVPSDAFIVLSTRRLDPICDPEILLRAIPKILSGIHRKIYFVFIGGGSLQPRLESLACSLGIEKQTRFTGSLAHEVLEECYADADAYVSVPRSDSTSVSLLEAMAAALPVVVNNVPSNLEWVTDGWNGYVVPRGDSDAIAQAVLRLVEDDGTRIEFGARCAQIAVEKAEHVANMRRMEGLYRALAQSGLVPDSVEML